MAICFIAGFLNLAVGASGNTVKVIAGMKIASDTISSTGDVASTWQDVTDLANGGDTTISDIGWDILIRLGSLRLLSTI